MNQHRDKRVTVVASSKQDGDMLFHILRSMGLDQIRVLLESREALDLDSHEASNIYIMYQNLAGLSGLSLIQKMRADAGFGNAQHLLLVDTINENMQVLFDEFDIRYVLQKPFTADRIANKLEAMLRAESELNPFDLAIRSARGAFLSGLLAMAREICLQLFRTFGYQERTLLLLGEIALKEMKTIEARKFFTAALKVNPEYLPAAHRMALSHMYDQDYTTAASLLDDLLPRNPLNLRVLADTGQSHYAVGNLQRSRSVMQQLRRLDEKNRQACDVLAKLAMGEGKVLDACRILRASHSEGEMIQFLNNEGVRLSKQQDMDGAISVYQQCLEEVGDSEFAHAIYYNLGLAYAKQKNKTEASRYFRQAIERKPDFVKAHQALARLEPIVA